MAGDLWEDWDVIFAIVSEEVWWKKRLKAAKATEAMLLEDWEEDIIRQVISVGVPQSLFWNGMDSVERRIFTQLEIK